jgi:cyclophilin family peptidyl-prolyl cis-trans isomerase
MTTKRMILSVALAVAVWLPGCSEKRPPAPTAGPQSSERNLMMENDDKPVVVMETTQGTMTIELWPDKAPKTVENFLQYVDDGFYEGTVFHRVIPGFMIQGGGMTKDLQPKPNRPPIPNEARADVKNLRGTLSMARTSDINSATSQFFVNVADNAFLDHQDETPRGYGYAVFGKVIDGLDVADRIVAVKTTTVGPFENVPVEPVVITDVHRK